MTPAQSYWSDLALLALSTNQAWTSHTGESFCQTFQKLWLEKSDFKENNFENENKCSFGIIKLDARLYAICFFKKDKEDTRVNLSFNCLEDNIVETNMANDTIPTEHKSALFLRLTANFPVKPQSQHQKLSLLSTLLERLGKA